MNGLYFHLVMLDGSYVSEDVLDELYNINSNEFTDTESLIALQQGGYESSWDSYEFDLIQLSLKFPNDVFVLDYQGEGTYKDYYKNGRFESVEGVMTFPDFDESKLGKFVLPEGCFEVLYDMEGSEYHGKRYIVREFPNINHDIFYYIYDGKDHYVGGGELLKKYCKKI